VTPEALAKAESLSRYCKARGCPLAEVRLVLTLGQGNELIDYIAEGGIGVFKNHDLLIQDVVEARSMGDPWMVLSNFQLEGFDIVRADELH
jgi:hypothetical protein